MAPRASAPWSVRRLGLGLAALSALATLLLAYEVRALAVLGVMLATASVALLPRALAHASKRLTARAAELEPSPLPPGDDHGAASLRDV